MRLLFDQNLSHKLPHLLSDLFPGSAQVRCSTSGRRTTAASGTWRRRAVSLSCRLMPISPNWPSCAARPRKSSGCAAATSRPVSSRTSSGAKQRRSRTSESTPRQPAWSFTDAAWVGERGRDDAQRRGYGGLERLRRSRREARVSRLAYADRGRSGHGGRVHAARVWTPPCPLKTPSPDPPRAATLPPAPPPRSVRR